MKNNRKAVEARQEKILNMVREQGEVRAEELAAAFGVSAMTVRRDLDILERQKLLKRNHGGAVSFERAHTTRRIGAEVQVFRDQISRFSARYLSDGDSVFINGSRVALNMLEYCRNKRIRVFTNNGHAIGQRYPEGISVHFTGGEMRGSVMIGEYVVRNLLTVTADKTFLGCAAVYDNGEFRYDIPTEIAINEMMISRTQGEIYVLADHSKLKKRSEEEHFHSGVTYERPITLVTDSGADPEIVERLRESGVQVVLVTE